MSTSDPSEDFVLVSDPMECLALAQEAAAIEGAAMQLDMEGDALAAAEAYRRAAARLEEAADACPYGHPDGPVLELHATEVLSRAAYLEGLNGAPAAAPLEEHICCVQLTLGSPQAPVPGHETRSARPTSAQVMGAAAAISGATGLLVLGPISGAALGVATALATTRRDQAGSVARKVGTSGVHLYCKAREMEKEHKIGKRVVAASRGAVHVVVVQAQQQLEALGERNETLGKLGSSLSKAGSVLASVASKVVPR